MTKIKLKPHYTFNNYIVGKFNELAYAAAQAVIKEPGVKYNPFFIYGGAGQGKTHLIQAIGNEIKRLHKNKKVLYATFEVLMNDWVSGIRKGTMDEFQKKYLKYDVIIIDDLQFIAGRQTCEEEVIYLFDLLLKNNKQIIVSLGDGPKYFVKLIDHAKSHYDAIIIVDIGKPGAEDRRILIKTRANKMKFRLTSKALDRFVAATNDGDIRKLEGLLNRI